MPPQGESVTKVRDMDDKEVKTLATAISENSEGLEKLGEEVKANERRNRGKVKCWIHKFKRKLSNQKASTQTLYL